MDATTELNLLETAYTSLLTGGIQSYSINGRSVTKNNMTFIVARMDQLRAIVYRQSNGMCSVARMRKPE